MENHEDHTLPAIRLKFDEKGNSYFEKGKIKTQTKIGASEFWFSKHVEEWEISQHPAPRRQFVVTIKGQLTFTVSDGSTFDIVPGVVLLAEDISGEGHSWQLQPGYESWERIYIPMTSDDDSYFIKD